MALSFTVSSVLTCFKKIQPPESNSILASIWLCLHTGKISLHSPTPLLTTYPSTYTRITLIHFAPAAWGELRPTLTPLSFSAAALREEIVLFLIFNCVLYCVSLFFVQMHLVLLSSPECSVGPYCPHYFSCLQTLCHLKIALATYMYFWSLVKISLASGPVSVLIDFACDSITE